MVLPRSAFLLQAVLLAWLCTGALAALAQSDKNPDPRTVLLDNLFVGSLAKIFDEISAKSGVKITFDREELSQISGMIRPMREPVRDVVQRLCRDHKLRFYIDADQVVHILGKNEPLPTEAAPLPEVRSYTGPPQKYRIEVAGKLQDSETGEALPFASITVLGKNQGASTNVDGYFVLDNVPSDTSTLVARYLGYLEKKIYLSPGDDYGNLIVQMMPASYITEEVLIVAEREDLMRSNTGSVSMVKISPAKLSLLPSIGDRDLMRAMQLMPGISAANENSSGLYVRGGTPDQNLMLYDGFTVYHVEHLFGFFSAFNPDAVKDMQLYKGGFPAKFGGRLSAVSEITGKEGNRNAFSGRLNAGLLSVSGFFEGPINDKWTFMAAARRSWKSPLYNTLFDAFAGENETPVLPGGNFPSVNSSVASYFYDLNGRLTFRPSERDIFSLSLYNGTDKMDNSTRIELPSFLGSSPLADLDFGISDLTRWGNLGSSLKWSRRWSKRFYTNSLLSYSQYYSERDRTAGGSFTDAEGEEREIRNGTLEDNKLRDATFKFDAEYRLGVAHTFEGGIQAAYNRILYTYAQNDTTRILDRDDVGGSIAAYVQDAISLADGKLRLVPGLRASYFTPTRRWYAEPRFSAIWQPSSRWRLSAATGRYAQFVNRVVREDILQGSRDFWILSDGERVPVSSAWHYIAGLSYESDGYLLSVEAYRKQLSGLTEYSLRFSANPQAGVAYDENFFNGRGYSQGIEWLAQKKVGDYSGWVSYTLAETRYQFDVYGKDYFPAAQDVTHEFKTVHTYKWRKWGFAATWVYATGKPYTAPEGAYSLTLLDNTQQDYINVGSKNGQRLPDYHRLDLSATLQIHSRMKSRDVAELGFSIFNLYNRQNVWYKQYEVVDNQLIENNVRFLGITPNLSLSIKL